MILRRFSQALQEQNWAAIGIEFVLLVLGVFLGIQVANWNAARVDHTDYEAALDRLDTEIDTNLSDLDTFDPDIKASLKIGSHALTVLQSCVDSEENRQIVETGLNEIRGTAGLRPRRSALDEMTSNPRLLSQQTAEQRKRFSEMLFFFDALQAAAEYAEFQPQTSGMENNPILRIGERYDNTTQYFGFNWTSTRRKLELNVPLSEACHDNQLVKSFFNWERRQGTLPAISRKWRVELMATKKLIEARP